MIMITQQWIPPKIPAFTGDLDWTLSLALARSSSWFILHGVFVTRSIMFFYSIESLGLCWMECEVYEKKKRHSHEYTGGPRRHVQRKSWLCYINDVEERNSRSGRRGKIFESKAMDACETERWSEWSDEDFGKRYLWFLGREGSDESMRTGWSEHRIVWGIESNGQCTSVFKTSLPRSKL